MERQACLTGACMAFLRRLRLSRNPLPTRHLAGSHVSSSALHLHPPAMLYVHPCSCPAPTLSSYMAASQSMVQSLSCSAVQCSSFPLTFFRSHLPVFPPSFCLFVRPFVPPWHCRSSPSCLVTVTQMLTWKRGGGRRYMAHTCLGVPSVCHAFNTH